MALVALHTLGKQRSSTVNVGWGIQRLLLPVKTKDKQILDCVIKKAHTLKHHVNVMLWFSGTLPSALSSFLACSHAHYVLTSVAILQWEGVWDWPPLASVGFKVKEYHNSVHTGYAVVEPYKYVQS